MMAAIKYVGKWAAVTIGVFGATLFMMKLFPPAHPNPDKIAAIIASPIVHTNVHGTDVATKQTIVSSEADLERIKTDSAEIILLQNTVRKLSRKPGSAAVIINTATRFDTTTRVTPDSIPCSFHQTIDNQWIEATILYSGKDSASLALQVRNEYAVVFETRKDTSFVTVHSLNPYTTTTGISSFQIPAPKRHKGRFWIGLVAGILFHLILHH